MARESAAHAIHEAFLGGGALDLGLGEDYHGFALHDLGVQLARLVHARLHATGQARDRGQRERAVRDRAVRDDVAAVHDGLPVGPARRPKLSRETAAVTQYATACGCLTACPARRFPKGGERPTGPAATASRQEPGDKTAWYSVGHARKAGGSACG